MTDRVVSEGKNIASHDEFLWNFVRLGFKLNYSYFHGRILIKWVQLGKFKGYYFIKLIL
jgi:hypothetical protein